jgi:hypothetical protein
MREGLAEENSRNCSSGRALTRRIFSSRVQAWMPHSEFRHRRALQLWREKLYDLQNQGAIITDPEQKFVSTRQNEEAHEKIREQGGKREA